MSVYVSSGKKILRHLDVLKAFQETGTLTPVSLQIAPTSRCNLKCSFCSNVNRNKHEDLSLGQITHVLSSSMKNGAKSVEWTGGGDPTQYSLIIEAIATAKILGYHQGMITNGIDLVKNVQNFIKELDWIRISLNALDYVDDIIIPANFKGTLGFSYVMNDDTKQETLFRLKAFVGKYHPKYVRIVPNCQISSEELEHTNIDLGVLVKSWGPPFFYQVKTFSHPDRCWWCHLKPFILHDGYVYPCSSVVLNDSANRCFHEKFRWKTIEEFCKFSRIKAIPYDCKDCFNCVFGEQNELMESIINPEMEKFL